MSLVPLLRYSWGRYSCWPEPSGIETLTNFITPGSVFGVLQVLSEEFCEMLGGTIVLWGSYELVINPESKIFV